MIQNSLSAIGDMLGRLTVLTVENAPADPAAPAQKKPPGLLDSLGMFPALVGIGLLFWLLLMRPQRKEQKNREEMLRAIKKNDRVLTIGGIYGVVTNVRDDSDEITIKVDEATGSKLRVTRASIARRIEDEPAKPES